MLRVISQTEHSAKNASTASINVNNASKHNSLCDYYKNSYIVIWNIVFHETLDTSDTKLDTSGSCVCVDCYMYQVYQLKDVSSLTFVRLSRVNCLRCGMCHRDVEIVI